MTSPLHHHSLYGSVRWSILLSLSTSAPNTSLLLNKNNTPIISSLHHHYIIITSPLHHHAVWGSILLSLSTSAPNTSLLLNNTPHYIIIASPLHHHYITITSSHSLVEHPPQFIHLGRELSSPPSHYIILKSTLHPMTSS